MMLFVATPAIVDWLLIVGNLLIGLTPLMAVFGLVLLTGCAKSCSAQNMQKKRVPAVKNLGDKINEFAAAKDPSKGKDPTGGTQLAAAADKANAAATKVQDAAAKEQEKEKEQTKDSDKGEEKKGEADEKEGEKSDKKQKSEKSDGKKENEEQKSNKSDKKEDEKKEGEGAEGGGGGSDKQE